MNIKILLSLGLALAGCGSMGKASRPVSTLPAEALAHLRPADRYGATAGDATPDAAHAPLVEAVRRGLPEGYRAFVTYDPALDAAAAAFAETYARRSMQPSTVVRTWIVAQTGETGTSTIRHVNWAQGGRDPRTRSVDDFSGFARKLVLRRVPYAFGVARVEVWPGRYGAAVLLVERTVTLDPLPRSLPANQPTPLRGRLNVLAAGLRLQIAGGATRVSVPIVVENDTFEVLIPALPTGQYMMEISARRSKSNPEQLSSWRNSLLLLPLAVGQPPAREPPPPTNLAFDESETDRERLRVDILAWINGVRARSSLAPIALHAGLSGMLSVRDADGPDGGPPLSLYEQASKLGVLSGHRFRETWGRTSWLGNLLEQLATQPRLLELLESPDATYLGVHLEVTPARGRGRPRFRYRLAVAARPTAQSTQDASSSD